MRISSTTKVYCTMWKLCDHKEEENRQIYVPIWFCSNVKNNLKVEKNMIFAGGSKLKTVKSKQYLSIWFLRSIYCAVRRRLPFENNLKANNIGRQFLFLEEKNYIFPFGFCEAHIVLWGGDSHGRGRDSFPSRHITETKHDDLTMMMMTMMRMITMTMTMMMNQDKAPWGG